MTTTEPEALQAMLARHRALEEGVRARVDELVSVAPGDEQARSVAELVAYLASEVLPHAAAEEQTVYQAAAVRRTLAETLKQMVDEHRSLAAATVRLAGSSDSGSAATEAEHLAALFSSHVSKENALVLPVLAADPTIDLGALTAEMHALIEEARNAPETSVQPNDDPTGTILALLMRATTALSKAGEADRACRLAAEAWAVLRESRPELAVRATAALHGLAKPVPTAAVTRSSLSRRAGVVEPELELDVRSFAPAQRHHLIFATYDELLPGTGFVLVNDHDPKPLGYQFEAEHRGEYSWDYLEQGPAVWRVRIGRPAR